MTPDGKSREKAQLSAHALDQNTETNKDLPCILKGSFHYFWSIFNPEFKQYQYRHSAPRTTLLRRMFRCQLSCLSTQSSHLSFWSTQASPTFMATLQVAEEPDTTQNEQLRCIRFSATKTALGLDGIELVLS